MTLKFGLTGSTGSLGKNFILKNKNIIFFRYKGDIRNKKKFSYWIKKNKFDALLHLAAIVPIKVVNKNKKKAYNVNYIGTKYCRLYNFIKKLNGFFHQHPCLWIIPKKIKESFKINPISYYGKRNI